MPLLDKCRWVEFYGDPQCSMAKTPAIFLDRDGVIIVEKHYLGDPDKVELYPGVVEILRSLRQLNVPIVVVSNQSGIGQGLFNWSDYLKVHQRMLDLLNMDRPFTAVYANSHHPSETQAEWRKPNPGMILQAASDLNIRLETSVMVGDKCVDLEAATRSGVKRVIHVKTGHGDCERPNVVNRFPQAELVDSLSSLDLDSLRAQLS